MQLDLAANPTQAAGALSTANAEDYAAARNARGLEDSLSLAFMESHEFVSLGCFCGVACALQTLGLHRYAYPFDWCRSDVRGVVHCLEASFEDFLTYRATKQEEFKSTLKSGTYTAYTGSRWGGSFWHHKIEEAGIQNDMTRRAERLMGLGCVPPSHPRVFVCGLNSTCDIDDVLDLRDSLRCALPETPFKLLLVIEFQKKTGAMQLEGTDILFYQIDKEVFQGSRRCDVIEERAEPYVEAIAFAIRCWTGHQESLATVVTLPTLADISAACEQWHGGDPSCELFQPTSFMGTRIAIGSVRSKLPNLVAERVGRFQLPANYKGGQIRADAWGTPMLFELPQSAVAGQTVELRMLEGVVKSTLIAMAASTASTLPMVVA